MIIRRTGLGGGARSKTPGSEDGELPSWTADTACNTAWALCVKTQKHSQLIMGGRYQSCISLTLDRLIVSVYTYIYVYTWFRAESVFSSLWLEYWMKTGVFLT